MCSHASTAVNFFLLLLLLLFFSPLALASSFFHHISSPPRVYSGFISCSVTGQTCYPSSTTILPPTSTPRMLIESFPEEDGFPRLRFAHFPPTPPPPSVIDARSDTVRSGIPFRRIRHAAIRSTRGSSREASLIMHAPLSTKMHTNGRENTGGGGERGKGW